MVNYQNAKIYKIESIEGKCMYIGSTCQKLYNRMSKHRYSFRNNLHVTSSKVLKYNDAVIILLLNYPCNNKEELISKEREYIKKYDCVNKYIPLRNDAEYYKDNKEQIKQRVKQYQEDNKEKIKIDNKKRRQTQSYKKRESEYMKERRKNKKMCECGKLISVDNYRHKNSKYHLSHI